MGKLKEFILLVKPYKKKAALTLLFIVIANLCGLFFPWGIKLLVDAVLPGKDAHLLNLLTLAFILTFIIKFYFSFKRECLISFISENVVVDLRNKIYWHLHKLSVKYIENTSTGRIISGVITDVESIRKFLFGGAVDFLYSLIDLSFIFILLLCIDWRLSLLAFIFLPFLGLSFVKFSRRIEDKQRIIKEKYADLSELLNEVFSGIRIVSGFAKNDYEREKFGLVQKQIIDASMKSNKLGALLWVGSDFFSSLGLVTILWFGAKACFLGRISAGSLIAFYTYLGMLLLPMVKIAVINSYFQEAAVSLERVNKILAEEPKVKEKLSSIVLGEVSGDIKFSGVFFSYDNEKLVLSDINLEIPAQQSVALVGKSGAGKTTLINLLLRFYDPVRGEVFIDGHNLKSISLSSYRSKIAMVLQDDYLFSASIRENILYSKPEARDDELMRASKLANAHSFITELPQGYDTNMGERGIKLSFGQRQRVSIARAILRNPAILILDEATSSLDSLTERAIIESAFKNAMRGRTTFIISHRLSSVSYADRIIFIENAGIAESGTHSELLEKKGLYWQMWLEQNNEKDKKGFKQAEAVSGKYFLP